MPLVTVSPSVVRIVSLATRGLPGTNGIIGQDGARGATGPRGATGSGARGATGSRGATGYTDAVNSGVTTTDITGIIKGSGGFTVAAVASTDYVRALGTAATQAAAGNHLHTGVYAPVAHSHSASYAPLSSVLNLGTAATQAAFGNHLHTGVYEPRGTAAATVAQHEANYAHSQIATNTAHRLTIGNPHSTSATNVGAEPALGNPAATAYALYSSLSGSRYWAPAATASGGGGTPSDTVTSGRVYGTASAAGGSTTYARGDHQHGTPSLGTSATQAAAGNHSHAASYAPLSSVLHLGAAATQAIAGNHAHTGADGVKLAGTASITIAGAPRVLGRLSSGPGVAEEVGIGTSATQVAAGNHTHSAYLTDAPSDGSTYGRNNGAWAVAGSGTASRWTAIAAGAYAATPVSDGKITLHTDVSANLPRGRRLEYYIGGVPYYGAVTNAGATWCNLRGIRLFGNVTSLKYGDRSTEDQIKLSVPGAFADGTNASLVDSDLYDELRWPNETAYAVGLDYSERTADSSASQPAVNIRINGTRVFTDNAGVGPYSTAATQYTGTSVSATAYALPYHGKVEIDVTKRATGTGTAMDFRGMLVLVKP